MESLSREFRDKFDILYNNIASDKAPGLDDYERSYFLTKAQEELVLDIYSGKTNPSESFEKTEELRRYLDSLIETQSILISEGRRLVIGYWFQGDIYTTAEHISGTNIPKTSDILNILVEDPSSNKYYEGYLVVGPSTPVYAWREIAAKPSITLEGNYSITLPSNLWFITYESATTPENNKSCLSRQTLEVIPVTQDEYHRIKKNPFRGNSKRVLRLECGKNQIELDSTLPIEYYTVRYVKKLKPIIINNLYSGSTPPSNPDLTINGECRETTCELNTALHEHIINRAVKLAIAAMVQSV